MRLFRIRAPSLPTAISLLALVIAMGGTAVAVAPTVVNIADPTTPANQAHVDATGKVSVGDGAGALTVDGTVTSQVASSLAVLHFTANVPAGSACVVLATPPAGKALIVDQVRVNVTSVTSPGPNQHLGFYTGTQCVTFVGELTPATVGQTAMTFGAGLGIRANSGLSVSRTGTVAANIFVDAHTVAPTAVPAG